MRLPPCEALKLIAFSEYQTFLSLFTVHTVRKWKCAFNCSWTSDPDQWEQSLYLPIDVQDLTGRSSQTTIAAGIDRGLEKRALAVKPGDTKQKCHKCGNTAKPQIEIVNFPEVLILIRDSAHVKTTRPDIPYTNDKLYMQYWTSNRGRSAENHAIQQQQNGLDAATIAYTSYSRDYKLVAGTGERVIDANRSKSVAFACAPSEAMHDWWFMDDELAQPVPGLEQLDRLQRKWDGHGIKVQQNVFPELFVFRRTDDADWDMNYHTSTVGAIGIESANELDDNAKARDARGRVVTDIFTQPIGEGLLKFKITLTPADPAANDSIPFSLELGYEYKGLHWRIDGKRMQGRLAPNRDSPFEPTRPTPLDALVMDRYYHRREGPATAHAMNFAITDLDNEGQPM